MDVGLFGPHSITWRIHDDPILAVGGIRALLQQALEPRAMAGVAAHSGFSADPWGRLTRTAEYVETVIYGTTAEAERAGARVRGIHRKLSALDPDTGARFRLDRPDLLLWVHACEVDSFLDTARRGGVRLSAEDADTYVREQVRAAELVGLPAADVPSAVGELAEYFSAMQPRLAVTPAAWEAMRFVLRPPMPTKVALLTPARPAWGSMAVLGLSLLPRWARRLYRLPALPTTDAGATVAVRALRTSLLALPASLREGPHAKAARARLALPA